MPLNLVMIYIGQNTVGSEDIPLILTLHVHAAYGLLEANSEESFHAIIVKFSYTSINLEPNATFPTESPQTFNIFHDTLVKSPCPITIYLLLGP